MYQIVNVCDYSPSNDISYAKVKINSAGGKNVSIMNSKLRKQTYISTPLMLTWGMSEFRDDKSGKVSYDLSLQFPNSEYPDENGEMFLQKLKEFENKIKLDAITNSKEWFNKPKMSADVIDALWTPMLKYPKNKETQESDYSKAPILKVKVPFWNGEWKTELYDMEQRQIWPSEVHASPVELIPKLTRIACVLQCGGIWFANGKFGVTWKLFQAVVKPPQSLRGTCHIKLNNIDRERISHNMSEDNDELDNFENNTTGGDRVNVKDSDNDDDDDDNNQTNTHTTTFTNEVNNAETETVPDSVTEEISSNRKKIVRRKKLTGDE